MPDFFNSTISVGDPWRSFIAAFLGFSVVGFLFNTFVRGVAARYLGKQPDETARQKVILAITTAGLLAVYTVGGALFTRVATRSLGISILVGCMFIFAFLLGIYMEPRLNRNASADESVPQAEPQVFWNRDDVSAVSAVVASIFFGSFCGWFTESSAAAFSVSALTWVIALFVFRRMDRSRESFRQGAGKVGS